MMGPVVEVIFAKRNIVNLLGRLPLNRSKLGPMFCACASVEPPRFQCELIGQTGVLHIGLRHTMVCTYAQRLLTVVRIELRSRNQT